jgi:SAM-dependent methyltransferase
MNNFRNLYHINQLPIFQNRMYDSKEEAIACPKGNICLVENLETGLVYNAVFSPELMLYDGNYQNEQALSPLFLQHLHTVATKIGHTMGKECLVEVGCGKGFFLEMLLAKGFDVTGFDPTYEGVNPRVKRQYFTPGAIKHANGIVLRHVLEHIQNPVDFLRQLRDANSGNGKIYIEVPCFDWICGHNAWFDVFYEHVNYFRLADFKRMFTEVIDCGRVFGGQYLYVIAELSSLKTPAIDMNDRVNFPSEFTKNIEEKNRIEKNRTAIWGGASKGVVFALLKERAGYPISTVIDINPAKQGKYLPGTGLQVKSPEEGVAGLGIGATIYIMNSNYIEEIKQMSNYSLNYIGIEYE